MFLEDKDNFKGRDYMIIKKGTKKEKILLFLSAALLFVLTVIAVHALRMSYYRSVQHGVESVLSQVYFVEFMPVDIAAEDWVFENGTTYEHEYIIFINSEDYSVGIYRVANDRIEGFYHTVCDFGHLSLKGQYAVRTKKDFVDSEDGAVRFWYCCDIGNIYLESLGYETAGSPSKMVRDADNPKNDLRFELRDAKWMYDNLEIGTYVVIF